jgi:hypothetical protein
MYFFGVHLAAGATRSAAAFFNSGAKARGEAESNRILARSITPQLVQWRQLQITEQAIARWNGARPMVEGQGSGLLLQVPLPK